MYRLYMKALGEGNGPVERPQGTAGSIPAAERIEV
jgi:hypothetical protein